MDFIKFRKTVLLEHIDFEVQNTIYCCISTKAAN